MSKEFTPEQFGAKCDGIANDQAAYEAMFLVCGARIAAGLGAAVRLEPGLSIVTGGLLVPPGLSIRGAGDASAIKTLGDTMVFKLLHANGVLLADFLLMGTGVGINQTGIESGYLGGDGADRLTIRGVNCTNFGGRGISNAYGTGNSPGPIVSDCRMVNCGVMGFGAYSQMTLTGCTATGCGVGLYISGGNIIFTGGDLGVNATGVKIIAGGNGAHSIVSNTNINHCATPIDCGAIANGMTFSACHIYQGALNFNGNPSLVHFNHCVLDPSSYTFTNSVCKFSDCDFPMAYFGSCTEVGTVKTDWIGCRALDLSIPPFIAARGGT